MNFGKTLDKKNKSSIRVPPLPTLRKSAYFQRKQFHDQKMVNCHLLSFIEFNEWLKICLFWFIPLVCSHYLFIWIQCYLELPTNYLRFVHTMNEFRVFGFDWVINKLVSGHNNNRNNNKRLRQSCLSNNRHFFCFLPSVSLLSLFRRCIWFVVVLTNSLLAKCKMVYNQNLRKIKQNKKIQKQTVLCVFRVIMWIVWICTLI